MGLENVAQFFRHEGHSTASSGIPLQGGVLVVVLVVVVCVLLEKVVAVVLRTQESHRIGHSLLKREDVQNWLPLSTALSTGSANPLHKSAVGVMTEHCSVKTMGALMVKLMVNP